MTTTEFRQHRRADRDLACQLACAKAIVRAFRLKQSLVAASAEAPTPPLPAAPMRPFVNAADLAQRMEWAARLTGDASQMVKSRLDRVSQIGLTRSIAVAPRASCLDALDRNYPNFADVTALVRRHVALAGRTSDAALKVPNLLLAGAPGVGKTAYAAELSHVLRLRFVSVDVPMLSADFSMSGLDPSYANAKPGLVFDALDDACIAPIVLLDELDKLPRTGEAVLGSLYALLEPHTAARFKDAALGLAMDASHITWIATCNDVDGVEPALRSRFELLTVPPPKAEQMAAVIESVHRQLRDGAAWSGSFLPDLSDAVVDALRMLTPRELRRMLEHGYASAAEAGRNQLEPSDLRPTAPTSRRPIGFCN